MSILTHRRPVAMPAPPSADRAPRPSFEQSATQVLQNLQESLGAMLAAAPGETHRATDVEKAFDIDYKLAWQVFRIATAVNPLAAGASVPARVSMHRLLKAAGKRRIAEPLIESVSAAFDAFEEFVTTDAGDRESLEGMLSAFLPEEREKQELAAKAAAFKARSQIMGIAAETEFFTTFWFPNSDGATVDMATLQGHIGLRRVWPGAPIHFGYENAGLNSTIRTLGGAPIENATGALIPEFSTSPLPEFKRHTTDQATYYSVAEQDIGLRSALDLVRGLYNARQRARFHQPGGRAHAGLLNILDVPSKRMTMDLFLHADVCPGAAPELTIHDTSRDGVVTKINDPSREHDRLQLHETVRSLGTGFVQAKLAHIPRYQEMLEHVRGRLNLNPSEFRGYRLDVQYPVYATQYTVAFRLPDPPTQPTVG